MAKNVLPRDEEYDFVEQPPRDFFCPITFDVLLEPYLTECCGHHLSETAYQQLHGQPCPVCKEEQLKAMRDKYHKRRVSSLKVRCPHKAEGCEWQGELGSLEKHLSAKSSAGECRYMDVDCPYACGERVQGLSLEEHKSQRCPLRPFTCQYCNYEALHQEITKEHWPVCENYPLPCPNECGEEEIQRQHLKGHLEQTCPLEEIKCDFSYAGCGAQLQRRLMSAHVKEGTEAHLFLLARKVPELEDKIKQQGEMIKQQADLIKELKEGEQDRILKVLCRTIPPVEFIMEDYEKLKANDDTWFSSPFYSHLGGYKMCLKVDANFLIAYVRVTVCLIRGEFDDHLSWPLKGTVILHNPLNQKVRLSGGGKLHEVKDCGIGSFLISHEELYRKYLKRGNLMLGVSKVKMRL